MCWIGDSCLCLSLSVSVWLFCCGRLLKFKWFISIQSDKMLGLLLGLFTGSKPVEKNGNYYLRLLRLDPNCSRMWIYGFPTIWVFFTFKILEVGMTHKFNPLWNLDSWSPTLDFRGGSSMNCFQSWGHFSAGAGAKAPWPPPLDPPLDLGIGGCTKNKLFPMLSEYKSCRCNSKRCFVTRLDRVLPSVAPH